MSFFSDRSPSRKFADDHHDKLDKPPKLCPICGLIAAGVVRRPKEIEYKHIKLSRNERGLLRRSTYCKVEM